MKHGFVDIVELLTSDTFNRLGVEPAQEKRSSRWCAIKTNPVYVCISISDKSTADLHEAKKDEASHKKWK